MQKILILVLVATGLISSGPCRAQQKAKWNELDAFHEVMSKTFHPAEEGKLEPIRSRSHEMLEKALAWKNSTAPAGYDKNGVIKNLKKLVNRAREVNELVKKNAADDAIKKELSELHDVFHEIVEKCENTSAH